MKKIASLLMTAALATSAFAGSPAPAYSGKGGKIVNPPAPSCDWFAPGFKVGGFAGGFIPETGSDDGLGGGLLAEYFFCENFGIEGSSSVFSTESAHWQFDLALVARLPMLNKCWAPYVLAGGGYHVNADNGWNWLVGGGVEAHLKGNMSAFADGAWHFGESDSDFTLVRLGLKFRL